MNNELLTTQSEGLKKEISNTVSYWFGLNMLDNTGVSKRVHKQLGNRESRQYKNLYNILVSDVSKVYSMNGIGKAVDGYSEKYEKYFDAFNKKLVDFSRITANKIIGVIETGLQGSFNAKRITTAVRELMTEREELFEKYLHKNIGQLENYVLLLIGAESGNDEYIFISEGSGACNRCGDLNNEKFKIEEAAAGINYPPIHPNCKCRIKIIEGYNNIRNRSSSSLEQIGSDNLLGRLPYIDNDAERIGAENNDDNIFATTTLNPVYPEPVNYGPFQWETLPKEYSWDYIIPSSETTAEEDDYDIEPFMKIPLEERVKLTVENGYEQINEEKNLPIVDLDWKNISENPISTCGLTKEQLRTAFISIVTKHGKGSNPEWLAEYTDIFFEIEQTYGINVVFLAGLVGSEGSWDENERCIREGNNLFGMTGKDGSNGSYIIYTDDRPVQITKYLTKEESIRDMADWLATSYLKPGSKFYKETETGEFDYYNFIKNYVFGDDTLPDSADKVFKQWNHKTDCIGTVIKYIPEY